MSCPQCFRAVSILVQLLGPPHGDEAVADVRSDAILLNRAADHILIFCTFSYRVFEVCMPRRDSSRAKELGHCAV